MAKTLILTKKVPTKKTGKTLVLTKKQSSPTPRKTRGSKYV